MPWASIRGIFTKSVCLKSGLDDILRVSEDPRSDSSQSSRHENPSFGIFTEFANDFKRTEVDSDCRYFADNGGAQAPQKAFIARPFHNGFDSIRHFITFRSDLHLRFHQLHWRSDKSLKKIQNSGSVMILIFMTTISSQLQLLS